MRWRIGSLSSNRATMLLVPNALGAMAFTRVGPANYFDANAVMQTASQDVPRFVGVDGRLLVEGQRTNYLYNARAAGATVGAIQNPSGSGMLPTNWSMAGTTPTVEVIASGTDAGRPYADVLFSHASGGSAWGLAFGVSTEAPAAVGQTWTGNFSAKLISGSTSPLSLTSNLLVAGSSEQFNSATINITATWMRFDVTGTLSTAGATGIVNRLRCGTPSGAYSVVIRLSAPTLEMAPYASSPIFAPIGELANSVRYADVPLWAPSTSTLASHGAIIMRAVLQQAAASTANQGLVCISDGTNNNRLALRNDAGALTLSPIVVSGGVTIGTQPSLGSAVVGTAFNVGIRWGAGGVDAIGPSGTLQHVADSIPPGLAQVLAGHAMPDLTTSLFGEIATMQALPYKPSDAEFATRVAALS